MFFCSKLLSVLFKLRHCFFSVRYTELDVARRGFHEYRYCCVQRDVHGPQTVRVQIPVGAETLLRCSATSLSRFSKTSIQKFIIGTRVKRNQKLCLCQYFTNQVIQCHSKYLTLISVLFLLDRIFQGLWHEGGDVTGDDLTENQGEIQVPGIHLP